MYRIGIDVGSTFAKYCIMKDEKVHSLYSEKTPVRQKEYFEKKILLLREEYPESKIVSCGYGRKNVAGLCGINELTALSRGVFFAAESSETVLDIGGQDTKLVVCRDGKLKEFFLNDKCAAGSGMFLMNTLELLDVKFEEIDLEEVSRAYSLSSTCAVFAQSEIVRMVADNYTEKEIIYSVVSQILVKAKSLLSKTDAEKILLSGGLSTVKGIDRLAGKVLGCKCETIENGAYLAAIGCALERE